MASPLAHKGAQLIIGGWSFFIVENVVISENRDQLLAYLGSETIYRALYGTLSTAACCSIAVGYFRFGRGQGPLVWRPSAGMQGAAFGLQALGLVGLSQLAPPLQLPFTIGPGGAPSAAHEHPPISDEAAAGARSAATSVGLAARCPIDFDARKKVAGKEVAGVNRVTRHPMLWSLGLVGLGSALGSPLLTEVAFGGFFAVMALVGGAHQDHRYLKSGALDPAIYAATSHLPFYALVTQSLEKGGEPWQELVDEVAWANAGVALAAAAMLASRRGGRVRLLLQK
jgi:uncharacterized membrane protein